MGMSWIVNDARRPGRFKRTVLRKTGGVRCDAVEWNEWLTIRANCLSCASRKVFLFASSICKLPRSSSLVMRAICLSLASRSRLSRKPKIAMPPKSIARPCKPVLTELQACSTNHPACFVSMTMSSLHSCYTAHAYLSNFLNRKVLWSIRKGSNQLCGSYDKGYTSTTKVEHDVR